MPDIEAKTILYDISEKPFGTPYEEWTKKWWQWLVAIPKAVNPANDPSGGFGNTNQPEQNVFFLAGAMNRKATRRISIPANRAILFPIFNTEHSMFERPAAKGNPKALFGFSEDELNDLYSAELTIDEGMDRERVFYTGELYKYIVTTPYPFNLDFAKDNIFDTSDGPTTATAAGVWA